MRLFVLFAFAAALLGSGCELLEEEDYGDAYVRLSDSIITPSWAERSPTAADIQRAYPQAAFDSDIEGRVVLRCTVQPSRALACTVDRDEQPGYGFDQAALAVAKLFLVKVAEPGSPTAVGQKVRVPIRFELE